MLENNSKNVRFLSRMGAQGSFGQAIYDMAVDEKEFYAVSADLGIASGFERLMNNYPEKFINVGIAEQNLISVAAGISESNVPVFASSWAPFVTYRCADQIRVFAGIMKKNIKMVGMASGMHIPKFGSSHYGLGDITLMRSISNIVIISPCDGLEIYRAIYAVQTIEKPVYIRLTGGDILPIINKSWETAPFEIGKANILLQGKDIVFIGCGCILKNVQLVAEKLQNLGISCTIINMHTIRPIDEECLENCMNYKMIVTIEEHSVLGGLGGAVAEYFAGKSLHPRILMLGVNDFYPLAGDYDYLLRQCKLDVDSMFECVLREYSQEN